MHPILELLLESCAEDIRERKNQSGTVLDKPKVYKLTEFEKPTGMATNVSVSCSFCRRGFFGQGGGGTFICGNYLAWFLRQDPNKVSESA